MSLPGSAEFIKTAADEAEEEAAFTAGFNATDIEPEQTEITTEAKPVLEVTTPVEPEPVVTPAPTAKVITEDDLNAVRESTRQEMQKIHDKVFGKVGELNQRIEAMKSTAAGISPKARERLKTEFPELAGMLFDDDGEPVAQTPAPSVAPAPQVQVAPVIVPDQPDQSKVLEERLLTRDHKDWKAVVGSPEFAAWKETLKPSEANELDDSWDADFISAKITDFKGWRAATVAQAASARTSTDTTRQQRIAAAVTPQGVPRINAISASEDDEEAAMAAAFKKR
jgi:hypothetical protein